MNRLCSPPRVSGTWDSPKSRHLPVTREAPKLHSAGAPPHEKKDRAQLTPHPTTVHLLESQKISNHEHLKPQKIPKKVNMDFVTQQGDQYSRLQHYCTDVLGAGKTNPWIKSIKAIRDCGKCFIHFLCSHLNMMLLFLFGSILGKHIDCPVNLRKNVFITTFFSHLYCSGYGTLKLELTRPVGTANLCSTLMHIFMMLIFLAFFPLASYYK